MRPRRRGGVHPRQGPRDAVRVLAGRMQDALRFLHDRAPGLPRQPHRRQHHQSGAQRRKLRKAHQPRLHGHGRALRQPPRRPTGHRGADGAVGPGMESQAHNRLVDRQAARDARAHQGHQSAHRPQRPRPLPQRARGADARPEGVAADKGDGDAAAVRLRPPAPPLRRIHHVGRRQRRPQARRRPCPPPPRHLGARQPDTLPRHPRQ